MKPHYLKFKFFIRISSFLVLIICWQSVIQSLFAQEGTPIVEKYIHPASVESGDPVSVLINVKGYSGNVDEPIPFDGVLVIDMSNSMDDDYPQSDPNDLRIDAAISFVNCVAPGTRLGIVTFSNDAVLYQDLTDNLTMVRNKLNNLRGQADGSTNMYDALNITNQHLIQQGSSQREKYAILLTDGSDNSGHSEQELLALATIAGNNDIHYHTIPLGPNADIAVLIVIALYSEGHSYGNVSASGLYDLYTQICNNAGYFAKTRNIILYEKITPQLRVIQGSVSTDIENISANQIVQFENSGNIVADIGSLKSGEGRFIQFKVFSDCLTPNSDEEITTVQVDQPYPNSKVTYIFGNYSGEVEVPERSYECIRPGDLRVIKNFDIESSTLTISLESRYVPDLENNIIRNLKVVENPSIYFQPNISSINPVPNQIFPSSATDFLYWEIKKLGPKEVKELKIKLEPRTCDGSYNPPIDVNARKYTGGDPGTITYQKPDGSINIIPMPFQNASLASVEHCDGRPDLFITTPYSIGEFNNHPTWSPFTISFKNETPDIWVDSEEPNGFWNLTDFNIGEFINSASIYGTSNDPSTIVHRINVDGQGDIFNPLLKNKIMVRIRNVGKINYPFTSNGAQLYVFDYNLMDWAELQSADIPEMQPNSSHLIVFNVPENTIQQSNIKPYAISAEDALTLIIRLNHSLGVSIRDWSRDHTQQWQNLVNMGEITPNDMRTMLPASCGLDIGCWLRGTLRDRFDDFINSNNSRLVWGKNCIKIKSVNTASQLEKHTNNNTSEEILLVN